ncbi:Dicer-like protein 1 [Talaromyces atroroseus]|uniref:Dicer-like protein 1 n=1 Tax=Talaromyces atroroseus TaxID=1441469 RepID=A0A1Q5Q7T8_TALAT|nr:Dicer-like protein 1 [Talaromyces atroroseus]OKL56214.1 Dicer-like protein 1 [Talaromyces atroroseus]
MDSTHAEDDPVFASDSEDDQDATAVTEQPARQKQNLYFKNLLSKAAKDLTEQELSAGTRDRAAELERSTRYLLKTQDFAATIDDPREYQIELFEKAKKENTIAVLATGLLGYSHKVKDVWRQHFTENMIIVCTADILQQCLLNAFIGMEDINLLIFDEAHHAKKDHAYARIIKDSYIKADPGCRPRIFGMTASPLDAKGDVVKAAHKIATTTNLALLQTVVSRPIEELWKYVEPGRPFKTFLYQTLEKQYGDMECLKKIFTFSLEATSALGPWCADRVWVAALSDDSLPKFHGKITTSFKRVASETAATMVNNEIQRLNRLSEVVANYKLPRGPDILEQLSDKVKVLYRNLLRRFVEAPKTKCIIFTKQRHTAQLLKEVLEELSIPNLYPGVLVGARSGDYAGMNATYNQQIKTTIKFRKGEFNCLFATSVAEEGLDIPDCNLVVRFDLYDTLIQYIQSRGRARRADSIYAHMVEIDNLEHETRLDQVHQEENVMSRFCEALPEDRILGRNGDTWNGLLEKEATKRQYKVEHTGATLTYHSALTVLARYASSLQYESNETSAQAHYVITQSRGRPATRKSLAKQSAAFDTCILLLKHRLLDDNFISTYHRRLPAMRNAKLSIKSKKTTQYSMIVKPAFWKKGYGVLPSSLYLTVIIFCPGNRLQREHRSIVLLAREPLPQFPEFPIYLENDIETSIRTVHLNKALTIQPEELELMTNFTLRVFQDLYNKVYEKDEENMPYWLLPTEADIKEFGEDIEPSDVIDWNALRFVDQHDQIERTSASPDEMIGRFVYDRWDGRYRYFLKGINTSLCASDPPPAFLPRRRNTCNIMEYGLSLYKKAHSTFLSTCDWKQCVYDAELIPLRRNLLDKLTETEKKMEKRAMLCLETQVISAIPANIVTSCFAVPAIITRFESYLVARECAESLGLEIQLAYALEAVTKDSDNTEEHRLEQVHLQRGMGKNYERLEFLGDCFLKMATSIALFAQNPNDQEFDFHVNRMTLICNRNLFNTAKERKLYEFVRSKAFSRRNWYPEGMKLLRGKTKQEKESANQHALGEKTIADVCEAIIGASLLSGGSVHRFDMAVRAVTALVNSDIHKADSWADYFSLYSLPPYQAQDADGFEKDLSSQIEKKLGYRFRYPRLLRSAFTHPSYPSAWSTVPCYQRLEFLGDSLLDMVCIEDLYKRFPDRDPQWLTEHKMAMVSNKFLGSLAVRLGLHTHLQHFSNPLQGQILQYVEDSQLVYESNQSVDFWLDTQDPPKCLSDIVEAYIGAIFVDSEFDFGVIEKFYSQHIKHYFEDMTLYDTFANKHPTTFLHRKLTDDFGCIEYSLKAAEIPTIDGAPTIVLAAVLVHDVELAQGTASSGRYAKVKASQIALKNLEGLSVEEFREKYHCKCSRTAFHGTVPTQDEIGCAI